MTISVISLRALFLFEFYQDFNVDRVSGKVYPYKKAAITFPFLLMKLLNSINDSRENFEKTENHLEKFFSRFGNLFYNYIFKFLILGLLIVATYPTLILINTIVCLCLMIISPVIVIAWNVLVYLISIIFYNKYGTLKCIPLIRIVFINLLISFLLQSILCTVRLVLQPIMSIIILFYAQIHFIISYIDDTIFYCLLKCVGTVPSSE